MGGGKSSIINFRTSGSGAGVVVVVKLVVVAIVVGVQVKEKVGNNRIRSNGSKTLDAGRWMQGGMPQVSAPVPDPAAP